MGKWFSRTGKREEIFLATKFGATVNEKGERSVNSSKAYVKRACERSLGRLGTGWIDLYYCHRVDGKTPIEETVEGMVELKK